MARHKRRRKHPRGYGDFGVLPFAIPVLPAIAAALGIGAYFVTKKKTTSDALRRFEPQTLPDGNRPTGNESVDNRQAELASQGVDTSKANSSDPAVRQSQLNAAEATAANQAGNEVVTANFQQGLQTAQLVTSAQMAFEAGTSQQYAEALASLAAHWGTSPDAAAAYLKLPATKALTSFAPPAKPATSLAPPPAVAPSYTPVIQGQLLPASSALPSTFFDAQVPRTNASPATSKLIGLFGGYFTPYR